MTPLDLAQEYAALGIPALPIAISWDDAKGKTNKRPLCQNGFYDATKDPERLRRMFSGVSGKPGEVVAVGPCPGAAGYIVVDLDVNEVVDGPDVFAGLEKEAGEKASTITVVTASGGQHLWFRKPDSMPTIGNVHRLGDGIDVRADAGVVVVPETVTVWGSWLWDGRSLLEGGEAAPCPGFVADRLDGGLFSQAGATSRWQPLDRGSLNSQDLAALEALERLGGHSAYSAGSGIEIVRPGKIAGASASIGYIAPGVVKVFTSNWPPPIQTGRTGHFPQSRMGSFLRVRTRTSIDLVNDRIQMTLLAKRSGGFGLPFSNLVCNTMSLPSCWFVTWDVCRRAKGPLAQSCSPQ